MSGLRDDHASASLRAQYEVAHEAYNLAVAEFGEESEAALGTRRLVATLYLRYLDSRSDLGVMYRGERYATVAP